MPPRSSCSEMQTGAAATEQKMAGAMGVSRNAEGSGRGVAGEGCSRTRQGAGPLSRPRSGRAARPFRIAVGGLPAVDEGSEIMELR